MTNHDIVEALRTLDFVACTFGSFLVVVGMENWMRGRSRMVRVFFGIIGFVMLMLFAHYWSTWQKGVVLAPPVVFGLHVILDWALVLAIFSAWLEHRSRNKIVK